jgi:acetylglutamate kinase
VTPSSVPSQADRSPSHAGRPVVVKLGGTTLAEQRGTLEEAVALARTRELVVVHGGGKRLTEWLARLGVQTRFEGGLRVTDDAALEVALAVLRGVVNGELVAALRALGGDAVGISGLDGGLLLAERVPGLGRVATVTGARPGMLRALLDAGALPVVAPLAIDATGLICNVNADDVAAGLASALGAELVLLTDTDGVRDADGRRIPALDPGTAEGLIASGVIGQGMQPKVRSGLRALPGSPEVVIAHGGAPGAISRALSDPAFGTRLRATTAQAQGTPVPSAAGG